MIAVARKYLLHDKPRFAITASGVPFAVNTASENVDYDGNLKRIWRVLVLKRNRGSHPVSPRTATSIAAGPPRSPQVTITAIVIKE